MLWGCQAPEHPGSDDAAGMLDPTRISCEEDARPQENILGGKMLQGSGFFFLEDPKKTSLAPCGSALASKGYMARLSLGTSHLAAGGCWKGMVQPILSNRHRSRGREPCQHHSCELSADPPRERVFLGFSQSY